MTSYTEQYLEQIYPMQDLVLKTVENSTTQFYLSGGTALNRAYLNVRYSDDLDLFVNEDLKFENSVYKVIENLLKSGFEFDEKTLSASKNYVSLFLSHKDFNKLLKINFVNDIPVYYGKPIKTSLFERTDCIENIMTNKLSALIGRSEIKDAVDLLSIARNYRFSWNDAISLAEKKEASVDSSLIAGVLCEINEQDLDKIKWVSKPDYSVLFKETEKMARDILTLNPNSLYENGSEVPFSY